MTLTLIVSWLVAGFLSYGLNLGYFTRRFPDQRHLGSCLFFGLTGWFGLLATLLFSHPYRFRLRPFSTEERWSEFQKKYKFLGREYFDENR